jgi:solute carrier family 25 oxoglutarate transporter 11
MLQEGKTFIGLGMQRGWYPFQILEEMNQAKGGLARYYSSIDAFLLRTVSYTTARIWAFGYFYDKVNKDPRRMARFDYFLGAGVAGGAVAGLATNPVEIVFNRMQVDELYPERARRNYRHFLDGFYRTMEEGALMRGSVAGALKLGLLCSSMAGIFDLCKENSYYFFGPHWINRLWSTVIACLVGTLVSMPFDHIRTRLHTMRPLPNGVMPYTGTLDCLYKILRYECNPKFGSNPQSLFAGLEAYFLRLFLICYVSQFLLDYYHSNSHVQEFWQPARFNYQTGIDYDIHDPYTDAFNKKLVSSYVGAGGMQAAQVNGKDGFVII